MSIIATFCILIVCISFIMLVIGVPIIAIVIYFSKKEEREENQYNEQCSWEHKEIPTTNQPPQKSV